MNDRELIELLAIIREAVPQQAFGDHAARVWKRLVGSLDFADAEEAAMRVLERKTFVSPAEIREEAAKIRQERRDKAGPIPAELLGNPDRPGEYKNRLEAAIATWSSRVRVSDQVAALVAADRARDEREDLRPENSPTFREIRAQIHPDRDEEWYRRRRESLRVKCRHCRMHPGRVCVGVDGDPLTKEPAHLDRLVDAGVVEERRGRTPEEAAAELGIPADYDPPPVP